MGVVRVGETRGFARVCSPIPQLHHQNRAGQCQSNAIGYHHWPGLKQQAVDQPHGHADGEHAVHAQRDAADIFGLKRVPGLWQKACRGQDGGERADQVSQIHGQSSMGCRLQWC